MVSLLNFQFYPVVGRVSTEPFRLSLLVGVTMTYVTVFQDELGVDDAAQPQTTGSIGAHVRWSRLSCGIEPVGCIKCIFHLKDF